MANNEKVETSTTEEPKTKYRGIKAMPFVIGNETFDKAGTVATAANLLVYLTTVFNMRRITATYFVQIYSGSTNLATLIGAFLSDTYFGRYNTLTFATISSFLGLLVVALTAVVEKLHPPQCGAWTTGACIGPTPGQLTFLVFGFVLLVIGAGGIRPCNMAFGADQFNPETESGKRQISSFFNWYYFTSASAILVSMTFIVYVQTDVSWSLGLGIPAILMFIACALFLLGSRLYVKVKPEGSPLKNVAQVIVAAVKKRKLELPEQPSLSLFNHIPPNSINSKLPYTDQFRFLGKGAILTAEDEINSDGSAANPWRLSSLQKAEEVKCLMRVMPIWVAGIFYSISLTQISTFGVFQALQSDRRLSSSFEIPAASYSIFGMLGLAIWIPLYDRIVVPLLRRFTGKEKGITLLQRTGIGMVLAAISMIISALVEARRRTLAPTKPTVGVGASRGAVSSMSGMWLVPQHIVIGVSEAFSVIGQVELFYNQSPENMRSIATAFLFCGSAISSYLSSVLASIVRWTTSRTATGNWLPEDLNEGRLDYFYYLVAALEILNFLYFLVCARWYKYKGFEESSHENSQPPRPHV